MLSPEQLAQRRTGITATDVASLVGLHPYRSAIDVYLEKTGRAAPFLGNDRTRWGDILEGPIRDDYAERHGVRVEVPGTLQHPTVAWALATPDGVCYRAREARPCNGLEIKTHSFRAAHQYGDPGTDEVPQHELIQCEWNLFVSGLDEWHLTAFIDGQPTDYRIQRDEDLIGMLRESAERFLVDHIRRDVPPNPDGSESYSRYLSTTYPQRHTDLVSLDDKPEAMATVHRLRLALERSREVEAEVEILKQNLKAVCGDHAGLKWGDPAEKKGRSSISYKASKASSRTNWEAAWRSLVTEAQLVLSATGDILDCAQSDDWSTVMSKLGDWSTALTNIADERRSIALHTEPVPGTRRFCVPRSWSKNSSKED